jgi:glycosyltransferase involved in cell wall biosynthesis
MPTFDLPSSNPYVTKFAYNYAKEWAEQGHEVVILHCISSYPDLFYTFLNLLNRFKRGKSDLNVYSNDKSALKQNSYIHEKVRIIRIPITKYLPHREFSNMSFNCLKNKMLMELQKFGYIPELVLADYLTPAAHLSIVLKQNYNIPCYIIMHQTDRNYFKKYKEIYRPIIEISDGVLHRTPVQQKLFHNIGCIHENEKYMYSGIPNDIELGKPKNSVKKIVYAGGLRKSKNIHLIIEALYKINNKNIMLDIIGEGPYENELKALVNNLSLKNRVEFNGRVERKTVLKKMSEADCFIMISKETFGMVYIEAMSQGCITIGVKNEGLDGIIIDGYNGFLAESMSTNSLLNVLSKIMYLPDDKVKDISSKAIETAKSFRDSDLAKDILTKLFKSTEYPNV